MSRAADDPWAEGLPELLGKRVRLRRLAERDAMAQIAIYGDPEVRRFGYAPKMDDEGDALAMIRQCAELVEARSIFHWGLATRDDDQAIGHMTLFHLEMEQGRAEVGYSMRRDLWGRGYASEGLAVLIRFAFERLGLRRLEADVDPRNPGSLRVLEKQGFQREGYLRERWNQDGEIQDGIFLGLLRREWTPPL